MISKKQKENEFRLELIFGLTIFYPLPVCLTFPLLMQKGTRPHYNIYAFYNATTTSLVSQCFFDLKIKYPLFFATVSTLPKSSSILEDVEGAPCFF